MYTSKSITHNIYISSKLNTSRKNINIYSLICKKTPKTNRAMDSECIKTALLRAISKTVDELNRFMKNVYLYIRTILPLKLKNIDAKP